MNVRDVRKDEYGVCAHSEGGISNLTIDMQACANNIQIRIRIMTSMTALRRPLGQDWYLCQGYMFHHQLAYQNRITTVRDTHF